MKKLFILSFMAGMLALVSCGGSETKQDAAAKDSAASAAAANKADSMLNKMSADTSTNTTKVSAADTTRR